MSTADSAVCAQMPGFGSTHWSVIGRAVGNQEEERQTALATLCEAYWFPLYAYLRGTGNSAEDAEDLTQGFFAHLLGTHGFDSVHPDKGRFRTFLLVSLKHYVSNQARAARAEKRGGGAPVISIDSDFAEATLCMAVGQEITPEQCYAQSWGRTEIFGADVDGNRYFLSRHGDDSGDGVTLPAETDERNLRIQDGKSRRSAHLHSAGVRRCEGNSDRSCRPSPLQ
ncbi:MAG: DNA-directed RNA polymerase specialized sigma24 family protein [Verrucomicrobiales bacterium]|jgi:DNA-directed RNA polymerase specialized sigma24 family protein